MPHRDKPINELLYDALRIHSARTSGRMPRKVVIHYDDGSTASYVLPVGPLPDLDQHTPEQEKWPPVDGWGFRPGEFSLNGTIYRLGGRDWQILRSIVESSQGITLAELRKKVWDGYPVEDSSLRSAISRLKKRLNETLGLPEEFELFTLSDGCYRIAPL